MSCRRLLIVLHDILSTCCLLEPIVEERISEV